MKLFCDCNSKWILDESLYNDKIVSGPQTRSKKSFGQCPDCQLFRWIDADYENMMFDLKQMNN